ncbi:MAG: hypothetical protein QMD04_14120, partial [Anaerolineales bacterium]|nr:hypothetical protein [Anaerolineales bacterium]
CQFQCRQPPVGKSVCQVFARVYFALAFFNLITSFKASLTAFSFGNAFATSGSNSTRFVPAR